MSSIRLLALVLVSISLFAGQSIVIDGTGSSMTFTDPNRANTLDFRVEMQLHNFTTPGTTANGFVYLNGIGIEFDHTTSGNLSLDLKRDSVEGGAPCVFSLTGRTNVLVRLQRDYSELIYHCEIWNSDGTGYSYSSKAITAVGSWAFSGGGIIETNASLQIGFLRADADLVALKSRPPVTADTGDIVELKFDGDGTDDSGNGRNLNSVAGVTFADTPDQGASALPVTPNTPTWAPFIPLRAGYPSPLASNSYSMTDSSADVTCLWHQVDHATGEAWTSTAIFDDRASCTPTLTGLVFGPYKFRLTVTDGNGAQDTADLDVGAVAYDANGVVIYPDARLESVIGPSVVLGSNPWEYADRQSVKMSEYIWPNYEVNGGGWFLEQEKSTVNDIARTGTVYSSSGNTSRVYGVGTNFRDVFCGGGTTVVGSPSIVVLRPHAEANAAPDVYSRPVSSCVSDTEIVISQTWQVTHIDSPGVAWGSYGTCSNCGDWLGINTTSNINFYDQALAHYTLYYRSGWVTARNSARWLADKWYRSIYSKNERRDIAPASAWLLATIDTGATKTYSNMIANLRDIASEVTTSATSSDPISDPRENGYSLAALALQALLDSDGTEKAAAQAALVTGYTNRWGAQQQANGNYINNAFEGDASRVLIVTNGSATVTKHSGTDFDAAYCGTFVTSGGTITIAEDRVTVTGSGSTFTNASAGHAMFIRGTLNSQPWSQVSLIASRSSDTALVLTHPWRGDADSITDYQIMSGRPSGGAYYFTFLGQVNSSGTLPSPVVPDADNWYWCRRVSGTEITLDKPYTGDTSSGNIYRRRTIQNLAGRGSQPFQQGIVGWALHLAADALDGYDDVTAALYRDRANEAVDWLWNYGRSTINKGMFYGVDYANCAALTVAEPAYECDASRSYNIELINLLARNYLYTADATDFSRANTIYAETFGLSGYATPEGLDGDGLAAPAIQESAYTFSTDLATKNLGQAWGVGGGQTWPAARVGGQAAVDNRTLTVQVASPLAYGDRIRITATNASGVAVTNTCEAVTCSVTSDFRAGGQVVKIQYYLDDVPVTPEGFLIVN